MSTLDNEKKELISKIAYFVKEELEKKHNGDIKNPFEFISKLENYIIVKFPSSEENLSGFTIKKGTHKCIYINSNNVLGRQNFSCWHEYYHSIDDEKELYVSLDDEKSEKEKEADYFASCILLPKKELQDYIIMTSKDIYELDIEDLVSIQYKFRTSFGALIERLNDVYDTKYFYKFQYINKNDQPSIEEYEKIIKKLELNIDLIKPTGDLVLPKSFYENLYSNVKSNRINLDKAEELMRLIKKKGGVLHD